MERLTDRRIAAAKSTKPTASDFLFDSEVSGLALRIYPTGLKSFVFIWHEAGRQRRKTMGRFPVWTIGKARREASKLRLKADAGQSVAAARGSRFEDLAEKWLDIVGKTRSPETYRKYDRLMRKLILSRFGKIEPRGLTRNAIEHWHAEISAGRPIEANRALACLSAFLGWVERDHLIERNPVPGLRRNPENQRHVFLAADEMVATHAALDADEDRPAALAIKLALLTGCRIGECCSLTSDQIDAVHALWVKQAGQVKQRKLHAVPIPKAAVTVALQLIQLGPPTYKDCHNCWERVRLKIGRADVRIHDLRHTRASALARHGASLQQIGKLLGHASPQTTQRYSHLVAADLRDLVERG
jgi:integrase